MLEEKKASDLGIESYVTLKRLETVIVPLGTEPYFKIFPVKRGKKSLFWVAHGLLPYTLSLRTKSCINCIIKLQQNIERSYLMD